MHPTDWLNLYLCGIHNLHNTCDGRIGFVLLTEDLNVTQLAEVEVPLRLQTSD